MAEILLELLSEEIPSRMQRRAADDLRSLVTNKCVDAGLTYVDAASFVTPRRLTLVISGILEKTRSKKEEKIGPRTSAPERAIEGFLRSTGLKKEQLFVRNEKKGDVYVAIVETPGQYVNDILAEIVPDVIRQFPWPKSMRWGNGQLRWVRPLHNILCIKTDDLGCSTVVPFQIEGISSSNETYGHRVMAKDSNIKITGGYNEYIDALEKNYVVLDTQERENSIWNDATTLAFAQGCEVIPDKKLLSEISGLVEWPVVLMGDIPEEFFCLPPEVLQTSMREHQKFLSVRSSTTGRIEKFITASNIATKDNGQRILAGNQRVLKARLADAKFFWENDLRTPYDTMESLLDNVTFHHKLGSQKQRILRIQDNAVHIAQLIGADQDMVKRAARICKIDLVSQMIFEFPELQGTMGTYYAMHAGETEAVAQVSKDHYKPLGPSDTIPESHICISVALADKIDMLSGFWVINEKPTGSKDPFALRRAALGIIRIIIENGINVDLKNIIQHAFGLHNSQMQDDLVIFIIERLKVYLKNKGIHHDLIEACLDIENDTFNLYLLIQRTQALQAIVNTDDGRDLVNLAKRVLNILNIEETKDGVEYSLDPQESLMQLDEEKKLFSSIDLHKTPINNYLGHNNFVKATELIAELKAPLDQFFKNVTVNSDNTIVRRNRLCLLNCVRNLTLKVANFSKIVS